MPDKSKKNIHSGRKSSKNIHSGRKSKGNIHGGRKSSSNISSGNKVRSVADNKEIPAKTNKPRTRRDTP